MIQEACQIYIKTINQHLSETAGKYNKILIENFQLVKIKYWLSKVKKSQITFLLLVDRNIIKQTRV